jgi:hypothetical protein
MMQRKLSECLLWALVKMLMRCDVAIRIALYLKLISKPTPTSRPPAGYTAGSPQFYAFYQAELETIELDVAGINHLCSLFHQVDHRLGEAYRAHFLASCQEPYRQGKLFK